MIKSKTKLYRVWRGMINRCCNPRMIYYQRYGGRGIKICQEWLNSFDSFEKWAYSTGYDEKAKRGECTIDRIDTNGNYEPSNCRWVSMKEQQNNRSNNHYVEIDGKTMTLSEWGQAEYYEASLPTIKTRIRRGWSDKDAITKPVRKFGKDLSKEKLLERKNRRIAE